MKLNRHLVLLPALLSLSLGTVFAAPAKRLIETNPGESRWATPAEMKALSEASHAAGKCGGFMDVTDYPINLNAPATKKLDLLGREPKQQAKVTPLLSKADGGNLIAIVTKLSAFEDRNYNTDKGVEASNWIKSQYAAIAGSRAGVQVELVAHSRFKQPSVVATIHGSGPNKDEIIVIGGHLDSMSSGRLAPGADDNAAGTATVMETFRILVESGFQPNRTLQFMGYAGEEEGLLGSQDIATRYKNAGKNVVGVVQFDMTMFATATPRMTFITDHVNPDLTKFLERLTDEYVKAKWIEDKCGYACYDHASWTRAGYASSFPFEPAFDEYNQDIHSPKDTVAKLDGDHGAKYLKLAIAFAIEMAQAEATRTEPTPPTPPSETPGSSWPSLKMTRR